MSSLFDVRRYAHWWLDRCFLYVGRMAVNKGVPLILRAWLQLAEEFGSACPPLWLVGGEPVEIEKVRTAFDDPIIATYEATGQIRWWGYLDAAGISTLLLKTYVLVTHSLYEPGGRVMLEAMSQGIPVIATPHGFAPDLIMDWRGGFLVEYGDVHGLAKRMEHFVSQPLLRHSMGRTAQRVASAALDTWRFVDTHHVIYTSAISNRPEQLLAAACRVSADPATTPLTRGFGGVYPFEGETVTDEAAMRFLAEQLGAPDFGLLELPCSTGRSRIWKASYGPECWIIKHSFSTYRTRPIWDRGFASAAVDTQASRISGEIFASQCSGAATLVASNRDAGLTIRNWLQQVELNLSTLNDCAKLLSAFHRSGMSIADLNPFREQLNHEWSEMSDARVVGELAAIEASWRQQNHSWHPWQPTSLRVGWRWLRLGLERQWLELPREFNSMIGDWIQEESHTCREEDGQSVFGLCHGDCDPEHFRIEKSGALVLIDCERIHPGYFGHDWSCLALYLIDQSADDYHAKQALEQCLGCVEEPVCSKRLLLSWLRWTAAMRVCRFSGLGDREGVTKATAGLQRLQRIT